MLRDRATRKGFAAALVALPWVVRERHVLPPELERQLRLLETARSTAERTRPEPRPVLAEPTPRAPVYSEPS
jgi:hypothetical protein